MVIHGKNFLTICLRVIRNAWQFWFAVSFVFKAQCGGFCIALLTT
ncbi:DUF3265 domain-containing protein [Vibrio parahaemolyticus]|nr:DUF3265 domain-containing protein [Vibrio parahaemolyticus]MBE4044002.1 DUF3265 domain-containing protein [Vibrio parahaemolyticus]MBE4390472.1 DUF3265 domain-containing protein [Vibrio parahaemolyticus]MBE4453759.1 DUF3265 domain-containing protein [Vibrio parahaemolyticus]MCG6442290.1 DUF3265 domain-containing protein [Vibrio parahaemolyticus]MCG6455626.1 DUF3265 domain-containing protein [Vibrio parahaemolyticus]